MIRVHNLKSQKESKNRSSKHLIPLTGPGTKSAYRSMSNAALEEMCRQSGKVRCYDAEKELNRRRNKRAKKEAKA